MASVAPIRTLERLRREPLRGWQLAAAVLIVWVAGALYCSGYDRLLWGVGNWPGSLLWSAVAVLPWLALFEWSKTSNGRRLAGSLDRLVLLLMATALASVALELATDALTGSSSRPLALLLLRRLPSMGACLLLLLWSRVTPKTYRRSVAEPELPAVADSVEWVAAADNYIELHAGGRVTMLRMTLQDAERSLRPLGFIRIHRRYLVNRDFIDSVELYGNPTVRLISGRVLPVGRAYAANLAAAAEAFATSPQKA